MSLFGSFHLRLVNCSQAMRDSLAEVMKVIMKSMTDPSPYVHFAAVRTVKAMSLDLPLHTLDEHANIIITWLLFTLEDGNKPAKQVINNDGLFMSFLV